MKLQGFIGPAYTLDSVNVAAQALVNMYPEGISPGLGKNAQRAYFKATPGLTEIADLGDGPIRCMHRDALGRTFVVSGNALYCLAHKDHFKYIPRVQFYNTHTVVQSVSFIDTSDDYIAEGTHGYYTGLKVQVSSTVTLPAGLSASTDYYVIRDTADRYKFASSLANALAGTAVDITDVGSGTLTTTPQLNNAAFYVGNSAVSIADDQFTMKDHGLWTGQHVQMITDGTLPTGLSENTDYYVIRVDDDNFKLASSVSNASAGTAVDITALYSATTWVSRLMTDKGLDQSGSAFTFNTSSGRIYAASSKNTGGTNNYTTIFTDGNDVYVYFDRFLTTTGFQPLESMTASGASTEYAQVLWLDSYYIYIDSKSNQFWLSQLGAYNPAGDFASAEGDSDNILSIIDNYRQLYLIGERTTEVFTNTGNSDFPYERVPGGFIEIGTAAKHSVAKIKDTIFFLGRTEEGANEVYKLNGTVPEKISTHAIDQAIAGYADPSACTAYTYSSKGHFFYVMNFSEATWVYDLSTGLWHQRAYTNAGSLERHLVEELLFFKQESLLLGGHYNDGKIFTLDDSVYSDNGNAITRLRSSPHLTNEDLWVFYNEFTLDMETGIGLDGSVQGSNPTVMMDFSDDGGHTWSSESFALADAGSGTIGDFRKEVTWRRLGKSKNRIFRVKMTDPVKCVWIDAFVKYKLGAV